VRVVEDSDLAYRAAKPNKVAEDHSYPQSEVLIKDKKHDGTRIDKTAHQEKPFCSRASQAITTFLKTLKPAWVALGSFGCPVKNVKSLDPL